MMVRILQMVAIAAAGLALGACSNLTAYPSGTYYAPRAMTPAEPVTITPDKVEGNGGPAVQGPTGG
jgi:hypothetical protein